MANKIVLIKKGKAEGVEFPLDADVGANARGIAHDGDDSFWILLTANPVSINKYRIDRKTSSAKFTGKSFTIANSIAGYGICTDGASLYCGVNTQRATNYSYNLLKIDRKTGVELGRFAYGTSSGVQISMAVNDVTFDGEKVWHSFQSGAFGALHRMRCQQVSKKNNAEQTFNISSGNALSRGISVVKGGSGFWWADTDSGDNYKLVSPNGGAFTIRGQVALTHSGTLRGMDDTGPLLAFVYN